MIQLSSLMWAMTMVFAVVGFMRGWSRELMATAGILLGLFAIFQFDNILRGTIFLLMGQDQIFLLQSAIFLGVVFLVYQARELQSLQRRRDDTGAGIIGILIGGINGYLIAGSLWYFLDINEYPLTQFIVAPSANSPSAQTVGSIPIVLLGGGASSTGDVMAVGVILLLFFLLMRV